MKEVYELHSMNPIKLRSKQLEVVERRKLKERCVWLLKEESWNNVVCESKNRAMIGYNKQPIKILATLQNIFHKAKARDTQCASRSA